MIEIQINNFKSGLYIYRRVEDGRIVYIGKDSNLIANRRHYDHQRSDFKEGKRGQMINRIIQDNPHKYVYEQWLFCSPEWIDAVEEEMIDKYRPEFNILSNDRYKGNKKSAKVEKLIKLNDEEQYEN